jgi:hypothetical protein
MEIREQLGLLPNTEVTLEVRGGAARLVKVSGKKRSKGAPPQPPCLRAKDVRLSTDEIMALTRKPADAGHGRRK